MPRSLKASAAARRAAWKRGKVLASSTLLLVTCLAGGAPAASASSSPCWSDPTPSSCASFTVENLTLVPDLNAICAQPLASNASNGWPAACTLWAQCKAGATGPGAVAYCSPLVLIQSACNESPQLPQCAKQVAGGGRCQQAHGLRQPLLPLPPTAANRSPSPRAPLPHPSYLTLCAPQSVVKQCTTSPRISALHSATSYYQDVQAMCAPGAAAAGAVACARCSSQSLSSDKVVVQALQANCPDPLGEGGRLGAAAAG